MDRKQPKYNPLCIAPVFLLIMLICLYQTGRGYAQQVAGEFSAGVPANFPPHYSIDSQTGKPAGFAIDVMDEVAQRSRIKVRYVVYPTWTKTVEAMEKGEVVLIPNTGIIAERAEYMDFTSPIETFNIVIFVRETTQDIKGITDLIGKAVAVVETNVGVYLMKERGVSKLQIYSSQDEALLSLISGKSDALVYPEPPIKTILWKAGLEDRIKIVGEPLLEVKRGIAVRKGNQELIKKLDDEIKIFTKSPRYIDIYAKWYGKPSPYWTATRMAVLGGCLLAFTVITLIVWRYLSLLGLNKELRINIEERKKADVALRVSEERFRAIASNTPDHILIQDRQLRYTFVLNPQLGLTEQDMIGKTDYDFLLNDEADKLAKVKRQVIETGKPYHFETSLISKEGNPEFFDVTYVPKFDTHGKVDGLIGYFRNVTEYKQAVEALQQKEEKFRNLFNNAEVGMFRTRFDGSEVLDVNERFLVIFGRTREEVLGRPSLIHWADPHEREEMVRRLKEHNRVAEYECRMLNKKGEIRHCLTSLVLYPDQEIFEGSIIDITERKLAEEQLMAAMSDLERSNKELEQFAYVASHDLQEPLRMVSSYTHLMAQHYEGRLDEKTKKFMNYAVDGAVRMQRLINDLLTYSRIGTQGKPMELTDTYSILGEVIRNLTAMIEENRAIITNDELPTVRADASQLVQLFQNLISNAIKFRSENIPHIHVSAQDRGREWVFAVRDNGIGIEKQYADRIFVIFQRLHTRQEYSGTGIGLSLCKKIAEHHGGRIWFESEPGKGSTFFFTITK